MMSESVFVDGECLVEVTMVGSMSVSATGML